jgi:serine/threonine protein kinase
MIHQPHGGLVRGPSFGGHIGGGIVQQQPKVPNEKPGVSFPEGTDFSDQSPKHLGAGQFGDVWEATDLETDEKVAVKVFYRHTPGGGKEYLTWNTADEPNKEEMKKNMKECTLVQQIISQGEKAYPVGASRICECKGEFIKQGMTNKDNVMYTVWEMCGKDMTKLRKELGSFAPKDRQIAARMMTKQVIEAVSLLSMFNPALIHHDMKADNAVVLGSLEEGYQVKLIDFGCFVRASPGNKYSQSIGDPDYMPPEHSVTSRAFEDPPSSFDIYGVGLIHMELLCPALENTDWSPMAQMTQAMMMMGQKPVLSMSTIENKMKARCPELFSRSFDGASISEDLDLIKQLTRQRPSARLAPAAALQHAALVATVDRVAPLQFRQGDRVEYYSTSLGGWEPCIVYEADAVNGWYFLVQEGTDGQLYELRQQADPVRVRAATEEERTPSLDASFEVPQVALVFSEGDTVEYFSSTEGKWVTCVIAKVTPNEMGGGTYDINLPNGTPFRLGVSPERVRDGTFPEGTKVFAYGSLLGIVLSFDADKNTYDLLKEGTTNAFYRNIPRDFVTLRE